MSPITPIAELDQSGNWTDYIYANGQKVAMVKPAELRLHAHGNRSGSVFGGGGFAFPPTRPIQPGDKLVWRQYNGGSAISGGVFLFFTDNTSNAWATSTGDGYTTNTGGGANTWVTRVGDLSAFAGETPAKLATVTDWGSQLGVWDMWFEDIAIVGADGTVFPLFHASPNLDLADAPIWVTDFSLQTDNAECVEDGGSCVSDSTAQPATSSSNGTTWFLGDHLGTAQMEFGLSGYPVWQGQFAPFGGELDGQTSANHYKFTGKERDTESGLDYFGARYYGSNMGRFMSPDPLLGSGRPWNPQTWNRYAYVLNNPLSFTDPNGLYEWGDSLGGSATDKQLKKNAGKDKAARAAAKGIIKERNAIRSALSELSHSGVDRLTNAASAIGGENDNNGVTINMGAVSPGASAEVSNTLPLTMDDGNPLLNLTVRPGASGDGLFIDLAHEGTHIADAQGVADGDTGPMLHIITELRGYLSTVAAAQYLHGQNAQSWGSVGPAGGNPFWSSSWSAVDQQTRPPVEIFNFVQHSPIYQGTNWTTAYRKPE